MAPPKRKLPSAHVVRRTKKPDAPTVTKKKRTSPSQAVRAAGSTTKAAAPLDNSLVNLYKNVTLCGDQNVVIGYDPGPNNGVFCMFIYGEEGLAASHGLCIPMKVDLFGEPAVEGVKQVESTAQSCRDRLVVWIRDHNWVPQQASLVVIERQLIACQRGGRMEFANQKTNTLATTLESKWEDRVVDERTQARLPIAPISKESFHFAYHDIFPVPPDGVDAHEFNKTSVVIYAEQKDALMAPFERQWVEADFTRNYYTQLAAGRTKTPKREADDYYDSAIFAMGGYEHAHAPAVRPSVIDFRKNNKDRITLELFVCPQMVMKGNREFSLFADGTRLLLVFRSCVHPLLNYIEELFEFAFAEGAVLSVHWKTRLAHSLLRRTHATILNNVTSSSELATPVDLTNEH